MLPAGQLTQLKNTKIPADERVDIVGIHIDTAIPAILRAEQYLCQVKNPYSFKCGDVAVNVRFSSDGRTLKDALKAYMQALKKSE